MQKIIFAAAAFSALATGAALAAPLEQGKFAGSVSVGGDFPIEGDVHGGTTSAVPLSAVAALRDPGAPALPSSLTAAGNSAELRIQSRSFDDIYDSAVSIALEGAYGIGANRELFGTVSWLSADEGSVQVGTAAVVNGSATVAEVPVFGRFGAYEALSLEGGLRQYFSTGGAFHPYVAGRLGVAFVDEIRGSFTVPDLNITQSLNNLPFYDETTTWTAGVDVGVSFAANDRVSWQLETGLRYVGDLDGNDSAIGGLGLASINEEGARLSVPVTARLRVAF